MKLCLLLFQIIIILFVPITYAQSYEYDNRDRLIQASYDNGMITTYQYDNQGNLLNIASSGGEVNTGSGSGGENTDTPTTDGGNIPNSDGGSCFIATAAFGSYLHDDVKVLRDFRDNYLLTNSFGTSFVDLYYTYSPPVADYIAKRDSVRTITRALLTPIVYAVKYPILSVLGLILLVLLWRRRKQHRSWSSLSFH